MSATQRPITPPDTRGGFASNGNAGPRWDPVHVAPAREPSSHVVDLREVLGRDAGELARLRDPLSVRVLRLEPGRVDLDLLDLGRGSLGLMVLEGLLLLELEAGRAHVGCLIGAPDLVRPEGLHELALTDWGRWSALTPARVALLDREFSQRAGGVPTVSQALVMRATGTANWLLAKSLIVSSPVIDERLLLLFALFGERWGKVTPKGVELRLPLTHANLAALCGARRPSVTVALNSLRREGVVECLGKGAWLLRRDHSGDGRRTSTWLPNYERSLGLNFSPGH